MPRFDKEVVALNEKGDEIHSWNLPENHVLSPLEHDDVNVEMLHVNGKLIVSMGQYIWALNPKKQ